MIGKAPYASQFGVTIPRDSRMPAEPPSLLFLNMVSHTTAKVHEGIIYGSIMRFDIHFLPGRSVLTIYHARIPPRGIAIMETTIATNSYTALIRMSFFMLNPQKRVKQCTEPKYLKILLLLLK